MARKTARDKILEAALRLMLSKGYSSTTVDEMCEEAGVAKGSFYHFFGTKEEVALAVLDQFAAHNAGVVAEGAYTRERDPMRRALALVDHLIAEAAEMWGGGCLLGSLALDLAETNPTVREAVSDKFDEVAENLADGLAPLASAGTTAPVVSPEDLAEHFIVVVEGALVLAKAHQDWGYVDRALERFRRQVRTAVATAS